MRALLALIVIAVAAGGIYVVLTVGCEEAPDFFLFRGACDRGVQESATQISIGVALVVGVAFVLDRRQRRRRRG